jgi:hypothetical protein
LIWGTLGGSNGLVEEIVRFEERARGGENLFIGGVVASFYAHDALGEPGVVGFEMSLEVIFTQAWANEENFFAVFERCAHGLEEVLLARIVPGVFGIARVVVVRGFFYGALHHAFFGEIENLCFFRIEPDDEVGHRCLSEIIGSGLVRLTAIRAQAWGLMDSAQTAAAIA